MCVCDVLHTHAVSHDLELQHALGATPSRLHDKVFERHVVHVLIKNTHASPAIIYQYTPSRGRNPSGKPKRGGDGVVVVGRWAVA